MKKEMKKYEGSWSANNGSIYNRGYVETNKRKLKKMLISICKDNVFPGNFAYWHIMDEEGNELENGMIRRGR